MVGKIYAIPIIVAFLSMMIISIPVVHADVPLPDITLLKTIAKPGESVDVEGVNFDPQNPLNILIQTDPVLLGTATTDSFGNFHTTVTIPLDTKLGLHHIVAQQGFKTAVQPITITAPSIPEFPFPFALVLVFIAVGAMYVLIRQKMIPNFRRY